MQLPPSCSSHSCSNSNCSCPNCNSPNPQLQLPQQQTSEFQQGSRPRTSQLAGKTRRAHSTAHRTQARYKKANFFVLLYQVPATEISLFFLHHSFSHYTLYWHIKSYFRLHSLISEKGKKLKQKQKQKQNSGKNTSGTFHIPTLPHKKNIQHTQFYISFKHLTYFF